MQSITKEIINFVEENDIKFIRLAFCDIFGVQKNISVMSSKLEEAFENGIGFDSFSVAGFENEKTSKLLLFPDPTTLAILPWRPSEGRVARFFCDVKYPNGQDFENNSRVILHRACQKAKSMGYITKIGFDCDFYLFKTDDEGNPTLIPYDEGEYLDVAPIDKGENIRREICLTLEEMGITPISSCHEHGPGQHRVTFKYSSPTTAADDFITFKWVVKAIANKNGGYATFMPKPIEDISGSGLHANIELFKNNENIFKNFNKDSKDGKYFIAGVLNRIEEITAMLNPIRNSYKRFGEFLAPKDITWSSENPLTLIKLDLDITNHEYMKLKSLDPTTNPYLSLALILFAGLEGIENKEQLSEDLHVKGMDMGECENNYKQLPDSFVEALNLLKLSTFTKDMLGESLVKNFIIRKEKDLKIDEEIQDLKFFLID